MAERTDATRGSGEPSERLPLKPLALPDASRIDGLKLLDTRDGPVLLFSTQERTAQGGYELLIRAAPVNAPARVTKVAAVEKLLPARALWDARLNANEKIELVFELAGGAINALMLQDAAGARRSVSAAHPFESFHRPHFVRVALGALSEDVGAVADHKSVVVFPDALVSKPPAYVALASSAEGLVGEGVSGWAVLKALVGGPALFDVMPGQLVLAWTSTVKGPQTGPLPFPSTLVYEFDAARLGNEVAVFATGTPAALLLSSRPARQRLFDAPDLQWLSRLSQPTMAVGATHLHLAALVEPGTPGARVLYGAIPLATLLGP
jgi:hypothetical protein